MENARHLMWMFCLRGTVSHVQDQAVIVGTNMW